MHREVVHVNLNSQEIQCLKAAMDANPSLLQFIEAANVNQRVEIPLDVAEEMRGLLTDYLAMVGFDADYNLTESGEIAESLIDKLYVP